MADQASMTNGADVRIHSPFTEGVIGNLAEFGNDMVELGELQVKLASHDVKECTRRAALYVGLAAVGVLLAVGLVPVALAGIGLWIASATGISAGLALVLTAAVTLLIAILLGLLALWGIRNSLDSFDRSRDELTRNLAWIKTVLAAPKRYQPRKKGRQPWGYSR